MPDRARCPLPPPALPLPQAGEGRGEGSAAAPSAAFFPLVLVLVLALTLGLPAGPAAAQQPAQQPCDAPELLAQDADNLAEHLPRCEKNAAYLYHLGSARNRQQRYEQAADHLERALMLAPDQPDALLQYAIALAGSGDVLSAVNLMADLRQRPDLPQRLRASLQTLVASWTQLLHPAGAAPLWARGGAPAQATSLVAGLRQGWDSNLQGASRLSELTLTLPGQSITLPIEPDQLPRSGGVLQADLRASHQRSSASGTRWGLQGAVQQRHTPALPGLTSSQAEWQFDYTAAPFGHTPQGTESDGGAPAATWAPWFSAGMAALQTRGGVRYGGNSLSLGLEHAASACATRWAIDGQQRSLRSNPILSSRYLGASLQWQCTDAPAGRQWLAAVRAGHDRATDPGRPGGDQAQAGLRLHLLAPAPSLLPLLGGVAARGAQWLLDADYTYNRDAHGYSPLLEDNRRRHIHRLTTRIEWQQPLTLGLPPAWADLRLVLGVESVAQNSSLPLFRVRSHGVWLGVRGQW